MTHLSVHLFFMWQTNGIPFFKKTIIEAPSLAYLRSIHLHLEGRANSSEVLVPPLYSHSFLVLSLSLSTNFFLHKNLCKYYLQLALYKFPCSIKFYFEFSILLFLVSEPAVNIGFNFLTVLVSAFISLCS